MILNPVPAEESWAKDVVLAVTSGLPAAFTVSTVPASKTNPTGFNRLRKNTGERGFFAADLRG
jgi:hypothetical protein